MTKPIPIDVNQNSSSSSPPHPSWCPQPRPRSNSFGYPTFTSPKSPGRLNTTLPSFPNDIQLDPRQSAQYAHQLRAAFGHNSTSSRRSSVSAKSPPLSPSVLSKSSFPATSASLKRRSSVPDGAFVGGLHPRPRGCSVDTTNDPVGFSVPSSASSSIVSPASSLNSSFSDTANDEMMFDKKPAKVHAPPPRSKVAIKFSPTYEVDQPAQTKAALPTGQLPGDNPLRRPPSPMAECILKGDFSFD